MSELTKDDIRALERIEDTGDTQGLTWLVNSMVNRYVRAERERLGKRFRSEADRASQRELSDPNAYLRRALWDRAAEIARQEPTDDQ